jgi:hypothetical protein
VEVAKPQYQPLIHVAVMDWWPLYLAIRPKIRQRRDNPQATRAHQAIELVAIPPCIITNLFRLIIKLLVKVGTLGNFRVGRTLRPKNRLILEP